MNKRYSVTCLTALLLAGQLAPLAGTIPSADAAVADRVGYFISPAFRDCYISVYNLGKNSVPVSIAILGGDGSAQAWVIPTGGYSKVNGARGTEVGGNVQGGSSTQFAFTKYYAKPGVIAGSITVSSTTNNPVVATGYCMSGKTQIAFPIMGGRPF